MCAPWTYVISCFSHYLSHSFPSLSVIAIAYVWCGLEYVKHWCNICLFHIINKCWKSPLHRSLLFLAKGCADMFLILVFRSLQCFAHHVQISVMKRSKFDLIHWWSDDKNNQLEKCIPHISRKSTFFSISYASIVPHSREFLLFRDIPVQLLTYLLC